MKVTAQALSLSRTVPSGSLQSKSRLELRKACPDMLPGLRGLPLSLLVAKGVLPLWQKKRKLWHGQLNWRSAGWRIFVLLLAL